jgi:hypothetical protein
MHERRTHAATGGAAGELEQAAAVRRGDDVHLRERVELAVGHPGRDLGELGAEEPAEAAALLGGDPRDYLGARAPEQRERSLPHAQLAQRMATVMVRDPPPAQAGPERLHSDHLHEELRELPGARGERLGPGSVRSLREIRIEAADHARAASGGQHHVLRTRQRLERMPRHAHGLGPPAGVVGRLTAARLSGRDLHGHADVAEQPDRVCARLGVELIAHAGCEERDAHGPALRPWRGSAPGPCPDP